MKQRHSRWFTSVLCRLFGKTRQALHKRLAGHGNRQRERQEALVCVQQLRALQPQVGTRKLYQTVGPLLRAKGIRMGRDKLFSLLRDHHLLVRRTKRRAVTTNSNHPFRKYPNVLRTLSIDRPEQAIVGDMTYLRVGSSFAYLSLLTDAYSRKILGYHLDATPAASGCILALKMALRNRDYPNQQLVHHTDRGTQYCSNDYVALLNRHHITISMATTGDPYENAIAERVNGILKTELLPQQPIRTFTDGNRLVREAVTIYNHHRLHASCDYLTPQQAHYRSGILKRRWQKYRRRYTNNQQEASTSFRT